MTECYQFFSPTKIVFGAGVSRDFSGDLSVLNIKKLLVISDGGIAGSGILSPIVESLKTAGIQVAGPYLDIKKDAPVDVITKCADFGRKNNVDGILAVGGGSVIDSAKAANILISHGGDLLQDYSGVQTIPSALLPLIVIPTTAGTGSEVTAAAVVKDAATGVKHSFVDNFLKPTLAILDPELTLKMPPELTAFTGIDAFSHALEAFTSPMHSPLSDALAVEAIRLIKENLISVLKNPEELSFRSEMMSAATIAGMAFDNAMVGVIHGIAHSLGAVADLHHGTAIFLALPAGVQYNMEAVKDRYDELARRLFLGDESFYDWLMRFRAEVADHSKLPLSFGDEGITKEILEKVSRGAANDGTSFYNPREVVPEELWRILCQHLNHQKS